MTAAEFLGQLLHSDKRITGASVMGAVFALSTVANDITTASSEAVATGMRTTFAIAAILIVVALVIAIRCRVIAKRIERSAVSVMILLDETRVSTGAARPARLPADPKEI